MLIEYGFWDYVPVDKAARLVRHSLLDQEGGGQSSAGNDKAVDTERPSETQAVDDGVQRNTNDSTTCTTASENDAVG